MLEIFDLIFDPGHGGRDPGAVGPTTYEKNNSLTLAQRTAALLEATGRFHVHFTRTEDKDFCSGYWNEPEDLRNRVNLSKTMPGKIFVSFHNNSAGIKAFGNEVYAAASGGEGEKLAQAINARMKSQLDMIDRGMKYAPWYVVKYSTPPAVLIEYGFINSEEDTILAKMDQAALVIAQGIGDFFNVQVTGEEEDVLDKAIVIFSKEDYWSADDVNAKLGGGIAVFNRNRQAAVPADAMKAKELYTIGGSTTGHPNEHLLSGKDKYATAAAVGEWINQ